MVVGIGIDSVTISRIAAWQEGMRRRFFGSEERTNAEQKANPDASLAACFAAKEAFGKALGIGIFGLPLKEIQLLNRGSGAPYLLLGANLIEKIQAKREQFSVDGIHVSITHEGNLATAVVLVET